MRLDHVSYAVSHNELADTVQRLGSLLGGTFVDGGRHPSFGTNNFVLPLTGGTYLEVVAALDHPAAEKAPFGRAVRARAEAGGGWMSWVISVEDIDPRRAAPRPPGGGRPPGPSRRRRADLEADRHQRRAGRPTLPYFTQWTCSRDLHPSVVATPVVSAVACEISGDRDADQGLDRRARSSTPLEPAEITVGRQRRRPCRRRTSVPPPARSSGSTEPSAGVTSLRRPAAGGPRRSRRRSGRRRRPLGELLEVGGAGVRAGRADPGDDRVDEVLDARALGVQEHPPAGDALLEQAPCGPGRTRSSPLVRLATARAEAIPKLSLYGAAVGVDVQVAGRLVGARRTRSRSSPRTRRRPGRARRRAGGALPRRPRRACRARGRPPRTRARPRTAAARRRSSSGSCTSRPGRRRP